MKNNQLENLKQNLPKEVYNSLKDATVPNLSKAVKLAILTTSIERLSSTLDCTEGLENAFKKNATKPDTLEQTMTTSRYTSSRIRRIALQNLLDIRKQFIIDCLSNNLYIHPLAYNKKHTDLLCALSCAAIPFFSSGKAKQSLSNTAKLCLEKDEFSDSIYSILTGKEYDNKTIIL